MSSAGSMARKSALRLLLAIALCLVPLLRARAHGPFDNSSQVIVRDETIEVVVTMGMDGSRQFLLQAGLSEADGAAALANRGPATAMTLSFDLAPKFFEIAVAGKPLVAQSVSVMTDGLEAAFTIVYPRPAIGDLRLHALYFNGIAAMKPGFFIATDENRNTLGAAMLSRANASIEVKLSATAPTTPDMVEKTTQDSPAPSATKVAMNNEGPSATSAGTGASPTFIWLSALLLAGTVFWIAARRLTRSR